MILYFFFGLLVFLGILRMFEAVLGEKNAQERFGLYANVLVYSLAVYLPFRYMFLSALFGACALLMLSLAFGAGLLRRLAASGLTLALLFGARLAAALLMPEAGALHEIAVSALAFFCAATAARDARRNRARAGLAAAAMREMDELAARHARETSSLKAEMSETLSRQLAMLDRFQIEDAEKSVKEALQKYGGQEN